MNLQNYIKNLVELLKFCDIHQLIVGLEVNFDDFYDLIRNNKKKFSVYLEKFLS